MGDRHACRAQHGISVAQIYRALNNPLIDRMIARFRGDRGEFIPKGAVAARRPAGVAHRIRGPATPTRSRTLPAVASSIADTRWKCGRQFLWRGGSLNGRLTTPIGGGPATARLTRREDRSAQPGCGPENLVIGRPLEGNSSVRLPATCVCRQNWLPRRIKRADCGPQGPGDLGNVGLSRLSTGRRRG